MSSAAGYSTVPVLALVGRCHMHQHSQLLLERHDGPPVQIDGGQPLPALGTLECSNPPFVQIGPGHHLVTWSAMWRAPQGGLSNHSVSGSGIIDVPGERCQVVSGHLTCSLYALHYQFSPPAVLAHGLNIIDGGIRFPLNSSWTDAASTT